MGAIFQNTDGQWLTFLAAPSSWWKGREEKMNNFDQTG
jgi:hypothetical protein